MAWLEDQLDFCQTCWSRRSEWKKDRFAYVAQVRTCPGCEVIGQEERNIPEEMRGMRGIQYFLVPRAEAMREEMVGGIS